jgi:hypothetical protein
VSTACSGTSTAPSWHSRVHLVLRERLFTNMGEGIRGVGFDVAIQSDGDTTWKPVFGSWYVRPEGTLLQVSDSLGPDFHGTLRLSLQPGYPGHSCPAMAAETLFVRYDQPQGRLSDTLLIIDTLAVNPLARLRLGELCATALGAGGEQAWFIVDSLAVPAESAFGRFEIQWETTNANYDGVFFGALQDSALTLELRGNDPNYCPAGGTARLRLHADSTLGVVAISPHRPSVLCAIVLQDSVLLFVPNPGIPWF